MLVEITLPIKAFSVNAYHYRDKRHKTAEARQWEADLLKELEEWKILHDMALDLKGDNTLAVSIVTEYPPHIFYNKQGQVSSKTFDLSNIEKPILDVVIGQFMGVNDKFVTKLKSVKRPGPRHAIIITLELNG